MGNLKNHNEIFENHPENHPNDQNSTRRDVLKIAPVGVFLFKLALYETLET